MKKKNKRHLFRMVIPASNTNVFSGVIKSTVSLGPIIVATVADKLIEWDVEVIHEAGCRKWIARDVQENINHQMLQKERPANVVGFYGGISCTMLRLWEVAKFYQSQGVLTISGGVHSNYLPLESLQNGIDVVVHGDGEIVIRDILQRFQNGEPFDGIDGISLLKDGDMVTSPPAITEAKHNKILENLPYPNFGLIRDCKIKAYPIGRIRGCSMNCEFCSVKGKVCWFSPEKLFETVRWLVETRGAKEFFLVDDRMEEDKDGTRRFLDLVRNKYGRRLKFYVQTRLEAAKDQDFLALMHDAGVRRVCIGYESPIDEDLRAMKKGYRSADMLEWTKIYHRFGFFIHAMFIFGYPGIYPSSLTAKERMKALKRFIRLAELDSIQILNPIPLPGSELRERLTESGQLLPLEVVPWEMYDGNHVNIIPNDKEMTLEELQKFPMKIMNWFYHSRSFLRIGFRTIIMPIDYILRGWQSWYRDWWNDIVRFGGSRVLEKWKKGNDENAFVEKIENWLKKRKRSYTMNS